MRRQVPDVARGEHVAQYVARVDDGERAELPLREEDKGLRRGKPLFLSKVRVAALLRMWLTHAVPLEVARARASSSSVIRANFY